MSMLVVVVMIGAALNVSASAVRARASDADRATAIALADALLDEILAKPYREDGAAPETLGLNPGESHDDRSTCDDVDDYDALDEKTIVSDDGVKIPGTRFWSRNVRVHWVTLENPDKESAIPSGLKRVVVSVSFREKVLAVRSGLRSVGE